MPRKITLRLLPDETRPHQRGLTYELRVTQIQRLDAFTSENLYLVMVILLQTCKHCKLYCRLPIAGAGRDV